MSRKAEIQRKTPAGRDAGAGGRPGRTQRNPPSPCAGDGPRTGADRGVRGHGGLHRRRHAASALLRAPGRLMTRGVTLLELMVAVAILGLLAAVSGVALRS